MPSERPPRPKRPAIPRERDETARQAIVHALEGRELTAKDLSAEVRLPEKDVYGHLEHIRRSLRDEEGRRLEVTPAKCLECGFEFRKRDRLSKPGRCPVCKSERVEPPAFSIDLARERPTLRD